MTTPGDREALNLAVAVGHEVIDRILHDAGYGEIAFIEQLFLILPTEATRAAMEHLQRCAGRSSTDTLPMPKR